MPSIAIVSAATASIVAVYIKYPILYSFSCAAIRVFLLLFAIYAAELLKRDQQPYAEETISIALALYYQGDLKHYVIK